MLSPGCCTVELSSGGHSVYIVQIFCVPPVLEFCPGLLSSSKNCPGLYRGVLRAIPIIGALAGAFAVFRKQDCRPRCRLRFPAVAQLKCERLVSLRRREHDLLVGKRGPTRAGRKVGMFSAPTVCLQAESTSILPLAGDKIPLLHQGTTEQRNRNTKPVEHKNKHKSSSYHPISFLRRYSKAGLASPFVNISPNCSVVSIFWMEIPRRWHSSCHQMVLIA